MLHVEHGPFSRLEPSFLGRLKSLKAGNPLAKVAVVVPSKHLASRLQSLIALEAQQAFLNVSFHTFYSFALGVLEESGLPGEAFIPDPLFHDRVIDSLLDSRPRLGNWYGGLSRPKALAASLRLSLRDLIDAGVSPKQVREHFGENLLKEEAVESSLWKLLELQELYQEWHRNRGVLGSSELSTAAAEGAESSKLLSAFSEIIYYGFYDLIGVQLEFFETVSSFFPSSLFLPHIKGHPAFRYSEEFFDLKAHRDGAPVSLPEEELSPLAPALKVLFSPSSPEKPVPEGALRVFAASGARDEVWKASKEILKLVEEEGYSFDDIAVCARGMESYRGACEEILAEDGVPCEVDQISLKRHPLGKLALDLLTLDRRDFPAQRVEDLLQSPYFQKGTLEDRARESIGQMTERLGIEAGWLVWKGRLTAASRSAAELGFLPEDARSVLDFLSRLRRLLISGEPGQSESGDGRETETPRTRPWSAWACNVQKILETYLGLPENPEAIEAEVWETVLSLTQSLAWFQPLGDVTWPFFLDTWVEKLESAALPSRGHRGVRLLDAMDARGYRFKAVFILGLQEGTFPRQIREDPLLRDDARSALKHPGGYWISRKLSGYEEERLLFYLLAASAKEKLFCIYSRSDEDGKALSPSIYLRELCRAAGKDLGTFSEAVPRQPGPRLLSCHPRWLNPIESRIRLALEEELPIPGMESSFERLRSLSSDGAAGPMDGIVGTPTEYLSRLAGKGVSPSALDVFGECPFRFFAARVLRLGEETEDVERGSFSSSMRGKIYHAVLERCYRSQEGKKAGGVPLSDALGEIFQKNSWQDLGLYPVLWKSVQAEVETNLKDFLSWDSERMSASGMVPLWVEKELSGPLPIPGLPVELGRLFFSGRADRIDWDLERRRFQVVDYKTRWKLESPRTLSLRGQKHQLPVYAELAKRELDAAHPGPPWRLEGAAIYALEDSPEANGKERAQEYSGEDWEADRAAVFEGISVYMKWIASGRFPIRPSEGAFGYCGWCSYANVCRKSHSRSRGRAEKAFSHSDYERIHQRKIA